MTEVNTLIEHDPAKIPDEITVGAKNGLGALSDADTAFVDRSFSEVFAMLSNEVKDCGDKK